MILFDENASTFFLFNCSMRWLAVRLDLLTGTHFIQRFKTNEILIRNGL